MPKLAATLALVSTLVSAQATGTLRVRVVLTDASGVATPVPRLVVLVMVDEPQGAIWGGIVAAPAFQQIAGFDLQYLEIPPDDPSSLPQQ